MKLSDVDSALSKKEVEITEASILDYVKSVASAITDKTSKGGIAARAAESEKSRQYAKIAKGMVKMWISYANGLNRVGALESLSSDILSGIQLTEAPDYRSINGFKLLNTDPIILYKTGSKYKKTSTGEWARADNNKQSVPIDTHTEDELDVAYDAAMAGKFDNPQSPEQDAKDTPHSPQNNNNGNVQLITELAKWLSKVTKLPPTTSFKLVSTSNIADPYNKKILYKIFFSALEHTAVNMQASGTKHSNAPVNKKTSDMLAQAGMSRNSADTMSAQWDTMSPAKQRKVLQALLAGAKGR